MLTIISSRDYNSDLDFYNDCSYDGDNDNCDDRNSDADKAGYECGENGSTQDSD